MVRNSVWTRSTSRLGTFASLGSAVTTASQEPSVGVGELRHRDDARFHGAPCLRRPLWRRRRPCRVRPRLRRHLFIATDGDLTNRGGNIAASGAVDIRAGGSVINETRDVTRAVDAFDHCLGEACGKDAADWNVAQIASGLDLTILADGDLVNRGGAFGAATDLTLAARGDVVLETLKESYLTKDYHQRGFLSGTDIVEHSITTA